MSELTAEILLNAYMNGVFPMAEARDDPDLFWVNPERRGIFPLDAFHVSKRLQKTIRREPFTVTVDKDFHRVMRGCAASQEDRPTTWINDTILDLYGELHDRGFAHSVECWQGETLAGGLYGVAFAGAFCGESMFTRVTDASKVALVYLVARLKWGGYSLLDAQFVTEHLARFGAIEISRREYQARLRDALHLRGEFYSLPASLDGSGILQSITQTS